jgi:hypothetical protein
MPVLPKMVFRAALRSAWFRPFSLSETIWITSPIGFILPVAS